MVHVLTHKMTSILYLAIEMAVRHASSTQDHCSQWVIWSVGPVGSLQTPADGIIPVPFKHYLRANYNGESDLHENSLGLPVSSATNPKPKACTPSHKNLLPSYMILADPLQVNFSRSPLNECQQLQCSGCDVPLTPWRQPELDLGDNFTVHARIGQSGGQRGYAGITGKQQI